MNRGLYPGLQEGPARAVPFIDGTNNLAIGFLALGLVNPGEASPPNLGATSSPNGFNNVAIGNGALASLTSGARSVAIGVNASTGVGTASDFVTVGYNANAGSSTSVTIGSEASCSSGQSLNVVIGYNASVTSASNSTVVGASASASGSSNVVIGEGASVTNAQQSVVIGVSASNVGGAGNVVVIGYNSSANSNSVVVGENAYATSSSVVIGYNGNVSSSVASSFVTVVGTSASGGSGNSVAVGYQAGNPDTYGYGPSNTVSLGYQAWAKAATSAAIGYGAYSITANQMVLGNPSNTTAVWIPSKLVIGNQGNLLTAIQSTFNTGVSTGWAAGTNGVISVVQPNSNTNASGTYALYGAYALALNSSSLGTASNATTPTGTSGIAVTGGTTYTAVASVLLGLSGATTAQISIFWWTSSGAAASTPSNTSSTVAPTGTTWLQASVTATAPSNAAFASITLTNNTTTFTSSTFLFTCIGFWAGSTTNWVLGATSAAGSISVIGGIGVGGNPPTVSGTFATIPPLSATIQTALGNLALGTAYQNTLSYDVRLTVYLSVTVNTSGVVSLGVGTTSTPSQSTIITGVTTTGFLPVTFKIPAGYYALLSISGTITDTIAGQYLEAV